MPGLMYQTGHDINLNTLGKSHSALPGGFEKQVCRIFACRPGGGALVPLCLQRVLQAISLSWAA